VVDVGVGVGVGMVVGSVCASVAVIVLLMPDFPLPLAAVIVNEPAFVTVTLPAQLP
jgi:hypothetical protein